jgi:ankyrin repeat protein
MLGSTLDRISFSPAQVGLLRGVRVTRFPNEEFREAVKGLNRGDFSGLEPLFMDQPSPNRRPCRIIEWFEQGLFLDEPSALAEAVTCACFLGCTGVADFLLTHGVDVLAGNGTGLNGFHWAVNRGQLKTVQLLIKRRSPLEIKNMYGGSVLGTAVWSFLNEPRTDHASIIQALIEAGAEVRDAGYPTGDERIDEVLRRNGA